MSAMLYINRILYLLFFSKNRFKSKILPFINHNPAMHKAVFNKPVVFSYTSWEHSQFCKDGESGVV